MKLSILSITLIISLYVFSIFDWQRHNGLDTQKILQSETYIGTPSRPEMEFKFKILFEKPLSINDLKLSVENILFRSLAPTPWAVTKNLNKPYYLTKSKDTYLFRDIYFDTLSNDNLKSDLTLRIRNRWKSIYHFQKYKTSNPLKYKPIRSELQAKVRTESLASGFSTAQEARLEFVDNIHTKVAHHKVYEPQPGRYLFQAATTGLFKNKATTPGKLLSQHYKDSSILFLKPKVAIYSLRSRFHINIDSPSGWGDNPNHAFIVTIDDFRSRNPTPFDLNDTRQFAPKDFTSQLTTQSIELEVEFERNASTRLKETDPLYSAFRKDHARLSEILVTALKDHGYTLIPFTESKYKQSVSLIAISNK